MLVLQVIEVSEMKVVLTKETIRIPQEVTVTVEHKAVTVTGPYGQEQRCFPNSQLDIQLQGNTVEVSCWQADKKARDMVGTVCAHIRNLVNGVAAGYQLSTVAVFKYYPILQTVAPNGHSVVIRNVMNTRRVRYVETQGKTVYSTTQVRDTGVLMGTSLEDVTQTAAALQRESKDDIKRDPVKFLDGIYRGKLEYLKQGYEPVRRTRRGQKTGGGS